MCIRFLNHYRRPGGCQFDWLNKSNSYLCSPYFFHSIKYLDWLPTFSLKLFVFGRKPYWYPKCFLGIRDSCVPRDGNRKIVLQIDWCSPPGMAAHTYCSDTQETEIQYSFVLEYSNFRLAWVTEWDTPSHFKTTVQILIPGMWHYGPFHMQRGFEDRNKLVILRWRDCSGQSQWQHVSTSVLSRGRQWI